MLLEEEVERGEAAQHVLGQVGAVHAQDQVLAPAAQDLLLVLRHLGAAGRPLEALGRDRQRVGAHPHLAALEADDAGLLVHVHVEQLAAAEHEVALVGARVEADDVVGEHALEDLLAHVAREHPPGVRLGPRDVHEVVEEHVRVGVPDRARRDVQVVVVQHHHGVLAVDLLEHRAGEVLVHGAVAVLEGVDLVAADVRRVREVPEVVLDEPQQRVRDDVVELVVGLRVALDEPDLVGHAVHVAVERAAAVLPADLDVLVRHRGGDPERVTMVHEPGERRHQPAAAPGDRQLAALVALERRGTAVRDEDELGFLGHAESEKIRSQSRRSRGVRK